VLVINAGNLIDGSGNPPRPRLRLLIDKGRIADIVDMTDSAIPEGAEVLEAGDCTVMPGLIDAHVHVMWGGNEDTTLIEDRGALISDLPATNALRALVYARRDLEAGFTTIRDMHCLDFVDIALRNAIAEGLVVGPRIAAGGYGLTSTGGHMDHRAGLRPDVSLGGFNNVVDTPDEARRATRYLIKMGADHIKINAGRGYRVHGRPIFFAPEMRRDVMQAICEEAHAAGRRVAAHSLGSDGELWAVQAGVDSIQHGHFLNDETLRLMAERGTYLVPTMTHCVRNARVRRAKLPPEEQADDLILRACDSMYQVLTKALALGVPIAAGTDAGAFGVPHGCNALEAELLTTAGLTPSQALVACTSGAAEVLDMADRIGSLRKGYDADLLIVRGDPLQDLRLLQNPANILVVMKEGHILVDRRP
jgi:imidazolonepropionase-like amidohydrolase